LYLSVFILPLFALSHASICPIYPILSIYLSYPIYLSYLPIISIYPIRLSYLTTSLRVGACVSVCVCP
jgi:hypothetical protein